MQQAAVSEPDSESPIRAARAQRKPLRLAPPHLDRLRLAKLDLGARYRVETDENTILDQFFEEAFDAWLQSKLAIAEPKPARRPRASKDEEPTR